MFQEFQSTRPTRDRDPLRGCLLPIDSDFNPRGPRGTATNQEVKKTIEARISIHAAHEGPRRQTNFFNL